MPLLLANATLVEAYTAPRPGHHVLIRGERIVAISPTPIAPPPDTTVIDLAGRRLMPGLIDAHVHIVASLVDLAANAAQPSSLAALRAGRLTTAMLDRGFTTVRDVGGADAGFATAIAEGTLAGPRLVVSGKALSQTGGHCDSRIRSDDRPWFEHRVGAMGRLVDGVDAVRRAAREELRAGAHFIKIMANGGIASPTDPIHALQYSEAEIRAIVEEAANAGAYVSAHLYTDAAIRRAVECGVHSLEHCNLITPETARLAAERGCVAVPTLVTYEVLATEGAGMGLPPESVAKIETVRHAGLASLQVMQGAGLPMAYGSDLLGGMQPHQSEEFRIRGRVLPAADVLAAATTVAARLCGLEGQAGVLAEGTLADLIAVDGDPLVDLSLLTGQGAHLPLIVAAGRVHKNLLH